MKYSIKYYPERRKEIVSNVPVMLSVTYSKLRMFYYTGKRCNIDEDKKKGQWNYQDSKLKQNQITPDGQTSQSFNSDLTDITKAVNDLFKVYELSQITPSPNQLRDDLKKKLGKEVKEPEKTGFSERFEQYIKDAELSHNSKKKHGTTLNKLKAFNPDTTFEKVDVQFLTDFQNFLLTDNNEGKLSKNSVISILRSFRAFINYANEHDWSNIYPFKNFKLDTESYGEPVFITIEERDKLYEAIIDNDCLSRVRDIFVFQCFIGCRVSDLVKLKKTNIIDGCIEYIAVKTEGKKSTVVRVPLSDKALKIIAKYDLPNGDLLPYITDQRYNEYIKQLFRKVELTRMVTIADPNTRKSVQKPISDIATSHMARRVFIGNLHHKGAKNEIIASMSGHVENSKAFSRYYNINKEDQAEAMKLIE